jgi:DNA polymerase III delta prime subunit
MSNDNISKLWVQKYAPKNVSDIILTPQTRKHLEGIIECPEKNFVNILLSGPAGTGKTTCAKMIPELLEMDTLYINASDENGIDVLRTKIKDFAYSKGVFNDKLKVVILDEAEGTSDAFQGALRAITEEVYSNTRFILTCNYPDKLIAPIHSRLREIVFFKPNKKEILKLIFRILKTENIETPEEELSKIPTLINKYYPDIRKMVNYLNSFCMDGTLKISFDDVMDDDVFDCLIDNLKNKKISEIRKLMRNNKIDSDVLITQIFDNILDSDNGVFSNLEENTRAEAIILCSDASYRNALVVDNEINFARFCVELSEII